MLSILLYAAETWTLLDADSRALEAFHMKCQRQLLQIKWHQFIRNDKITETLSISESVSHRCNSFFWSRRQVARGRSSAFYHLHVHQVANGVVAQAVLATGGLTRFGGTTVSCPLTSGGVPSVVVTEGRCYGLYQLSVSDDDDHLR